MRIVGNDLGLGAVTRMRADHAYAIPFGIGERKAAMTALLVVLWRVALNARGDKTPTQRVHVIGRKIKRGGGGLPG